MLEINLSAAMPRNEADHTSDLHEAREQSLSEVGQIRSTVWALGVPSEHRELLQAAAPFLEFHFITIKRPISDFRHRIVGSPNPIIASWGTSLSADQLAFATSERCLACSIWLTPLELIGSLHEKPIAAYTFWPDGPSDDDWLDFRGLQTDYDASAVAEIFDKDLVQAGSDNSSTAVCLVYAPAGAGNLFDVAALVDAARAWYPASDVVVADERPRSAAELAKLRITQMAHARPEILIRATAAFCLDIKGQALATIAGMRVHQFGTVDDGLGYATINSMSRKELAEYLFCRRSVYVDIGTSQPLTFISSTQWGHEIPLFDASILGQTVPTLDGFDFSLATFDRRDISAFQELGIGATPVFEEIRFARDGKIQPPKLLIETQNVTDALRRAMVSILRSANLDAELFFNPESTGGSIRCYLDTGARLYTGLVVDFLTHDATQVDISEIKFIDLPSLEDSKEFAYLERDIDVAYKLYHRNSRSAFLRKAEDPDFQFSAENLAMALRAGVYSARVLEEGFEFVIKSSKELTEPHLKLFLEKAWRTLGASILSKRVYDSFSGRVKDFSHDTIMLMAAFYCDIGDYPKSLTLAGEARRKEKNAWKWARYVGLSNLLYHERLALGEAWAEIDAECYDFFTAANGRFISLLEKSRGSYVVVGNSPKLVDARLGEEIDSRELVIRFNSAERGYPLSVDVGNRLDILIMNPDYSQTKRLVERDLELVVFSNGDLYSSRYLAQKIHDLKNHYKVELLPRPFDLSALRTVEGSPSSGLKTLKWIYSHFGPLADSQVRGFSLDDQKFGHATSYAYAQPKRMPVIHNWNAEAEFLRSMMQSTIEG